jgi:hypothetical protein
MRWLRKEAAKICPVHTAIVNKAVEHLVDTGVFSKDLVVEGTGMGAVADSIRWDYVREFIIEDQGVELIPLALAFFTRHQKQEEHLRPEKFLAQGYGKKTHGFAAVTKENDHLVIKRIEQRKALSNGVADSFQKFIDKIDARRVEEGLPSLTAPDPKLSKPEEDVMS